MFRLHHFLFADISGIEKVTSTILIFFTNFFENVNFYTWLWTCNMVSIATRVEQIVSESAFMTEGMSRGLINLSELARQLRPQLEKDLWRPVGQAAVVMALARLSERLRKHEQSETHLLSQMGELTTRSDLSEFTFLYSATFSQLQRRLLKLAEDHPGVYVTVIRGVREVMVVVGRSLIPAVEDTMCTEHLIARMDNLTALTLRLNPDARGTSGIYHAILKRLAWEKISLANMICTFSELTVLLEQNQAGRAFAVLSKAISC